MERESLVDVVIVVTTTDGAEVEVENFGVGNLDQEASECLLIGRAVRAALMRADDGAVVEVRAYTQ